MNEPIPWIASDLLKATKGDLLCGDENHSFKEIFIDSRRISTKDLFVAIIGRNHDGHKFIQEIVAQGVKGIVAEKNKIESSQIGLLKNNGVVCITVEDTVKALGALGAYQRKRAGVSVVAITGTNGKTTTRGMTASVLEKQFNTHSTSGNLNNEIGVPLTLFKLRQEHEWAVLELGMNHPGEIARLSKICDPEIGIITNIGPAHLEGLGSVDGVMRAKGELLEKMGQNGTAILNADDSKVVQLGSETKHRTIYYGCSKKADIRAENLEKKGIGTSFSINFQGEKIPINLGIPGKFMVSNALAAAAVGYKIGVSMSRIKTGIESFQPITGRMNVFSTENGIHVIDDTYNANPASMEAAMNTLNDLKENHRGILVAGDMFELGPEAEALHKKVGEFSADAKIEKLYTAGRFKDALADGALSKGMNPKDVLTGTKEDILNDLKNRLRPGDWILVKGSRAMGMELIVQGIKRRFGSDVSKN